LTNDKETNVGEISLPPVPMDRRPLAKFVWMGNCLSCIVCKDACYKRFEIYILDFDAGKWSFYHEMGPFDYVAACGREPNIFCVVFRLWINDQLIFRVVLGPLPREENYKGRKTMHLS
jgi:hypothetical protein